MPPGVTPITELKNQKRVSRTLSKAVSLHLEGKLESAARLLGKAIESTASKSPASSPRSATSSTRCAITSRPPPPTRSWSKSTPMHRTAWFNLGVCQGHLQELEVRRRNRSATRSTIDGTRSDALLGLGIALIHTGAPPEALAPIEKYLQQFPEHEQALFGKAVVLQQTGKHAEAVEHYRKVLARNPRCEEALSNLVAMFLEKKDAESVRRYAEMLAELQPESPVAMEALATLAFADGDYLTAARHCRNLAEIAPDRFESWFNLGVAYHKMGNHLKAAQAYQQATTLQAGLAPRCT